MTAQARTIALAAATDDLTWCATIPHTIDQIIGIHAEAIGARTRPMRHGLTNDEILSTLTNRSGGGGKGGHSDPTAMAALWGEPDSDDPDETLGSITSTIALIAGTLDELGQLCATVLGHQAPIGVHGRTRTETVANAVSAIHRLRPHLEPAIAVADDPGHLDMLVRISLAESAAWLRTKAAGIWADHHGDRLPVAVQRTIAECSCCSSWRSGTIAVTVDQLCAQCRDFRKHHKCKPTEVIVKRWEYGKGATPGQVAEAQAVSRRKVRAS